MKKPSIIAGAAALMLASCGGANQWTINGEINGGAGKSVVVEASSNGRWFPIDTAVIADNGNFSVSADAAGYPDIYRLNLEGQTVYFPIDSIETVTISAAADNFADGYALTGSAAAETLTSVDRKVMEVVKAKGEAAIATDSLLKREVSQLLLGDPSGIVAYYIISKKVGGTPLFNPQDKKDVRVIGAVANAFSQQRPNDPRTAYLKTLYLSNRGMLAGANAAANDTVYIAESPLIDIKLSDYTGATYSLAEVAKQGKVVILNFTVYGVEESTAFNIELAKIYDRRKAAGLEIFQVSDGGDELQWMQAAKNLPWITVYNSPVTDVENLMNYNVRTLPTTFIINRKGEIVERVDDITRLDAALSKYM